MNYDVGDQIRCSVAFANASSVATDPTVVKFKFRTPTGVETEYVYGTDAEVVRTAAGAYYVDVTLDEASSAPGGRNWSVRWVGSGNLVTASEQDIRVRVSKFSDPL
jgi:hypothetical protein